MNTPAAVQPAFLPGIRPDILIVEDDEMVQAFLALHLENEGYGVLRRATEPKCSAPCRRERRT